MKHLVAILLLCLTANAGPIGFMQPRIGGTSLVGWWTFNATNAGAVTEFSGLALTGFLTNSPALTNGIIGDALNFNSASSQFVNCGTGQNLTSLTIAAWINFRGSGNPAAICYRTAPSPWNHNWYFSVETDGKLKFGFYNGSTYPEGKSTSSIASNVWTHVAVTFGSGTATFYTNGIAAGSTNSMGTPSPSGALKIGIGASSAELFHYFNGIIDDPRIYNTVMTAAEILQLYNGGKGTQQ